MKAKAHIHAVFQSQSNKCLRKASVFDAVGSSGGPPLSSVTGTVLTRMRKIDVFESVAAGHRYSHFFRSWDPVTKRNSQSGDSSRDDPRAPSLPRRTPPQELQVGKAPLHHQRRHPSANLGNIS